MNTNTSIPPSQSDQLHHDQSDGMDHEQPVKKSFFKTARILIPGMLLVVVGGMLLYSSVSSIDQRQIVDSKASTNQAVSWISFNPTTYATSPGSDTEPPPLPVVRIHKDSNRKITAIHLEFSYNPANIANFSVTTKDWAKNKPPVILEPFATQVTNGQGKATITLGAPCDNKKCYPLKKTVTDILTLHFQPSFTSTIDLTVNTKVTMTGGTENTFSDTLTEPLTVIRTN